MMKLSRNGLRKHTEIAEYAEISFFEHGLHEFSRIFFLPKPRKHHSSIIVLCCTNYII